SERIEFVNCYTYLGLTIPFNCKNFALHVKERCSRALRATYALRDTRVLSVQTALTLFDFKIKPILSFGIQHIWNELSMSSLRKIDSVKSSYVKRLLGVSIYSKSRLVYLLMNTQPLVVELQVAFRLPKILAYTEHVTSLEQKQISVDFDFFFTPGVMNDTWKGPHQDLRHILTRHAVHGFHHILCRTSQYHEASESCVCRWCNMTGISQYHLL